MTNKDNTDILDVYLLWKEDPAKYGYLMDDRVSKIINYLVKTRKINFFPDERTEEFDDLFQQAKIWVFDRVLPNITEPTAKRIFNYIHINLRFKFLLGGRAKIAKVIDNNYAELQHGIEVINSKDEYYNRSIERNDAILFDCIDRMELTSKEKKLAKLLAQGYTKPDLVEDYNLTPSEWNTFRRKMTNQMKIHEIYTP